MPNKQEPLFTRKVKHTDIEKESLYKIYRLYKFGVDFPGYLQ